MYGDIDNIVDFFMMLEHATEESRKKAYEERRKSFKYTLEKHDPEPEFMKKFQNPDRELYILNTPNGPIKNKFFANWNRTEEKLNTDRYVVLREYYEDRYDDKIMESCHGKNWKIADKNTGKPATPYHLDTHDVVFDTTKCEIVYETPKESYPIPYIFFYDNIAGIAKDGKPTIYFNLEKKETICESSDKIIETENHIILGIDHYYDSRAAKKSATVINKHTCEVTTID